MILKFNWMLSTCMNLKLFSLSSGDSIFFLSMPAGKYATQYILDNGNLPSLDTGSFVVFYEYIAHFNLHNLGVVFGLGGPWISAWIAHWYNTILVM